VCVFSIYIYDIDLSNFDVHKYFTSDKLHECTHMTTYDNSVQLGPVIDAYLISAFKTNSLVRMNRKGLRI